MKNVYKLTAYDSELKAYTSENFYSNLKAAKASFESLKRHIMRKEDINFTKCKIVEWFYTDKGANKTEIIDDRFNITLTKWNVAKVASEWL